jgi:uncharacterized protein (DUF2147 family)
MKKLLYTFLALPVLLLLLAATVQTGWQADDIIGEWYTDGNKSVIRIYKNRAGRYFGKIEWIKDPNEEDGSAKVDKENPDASLRNQPLLGLVILRNFTFEDNRWAGGTIYDPENGKTYRCNMRLEDRNTLHVRGYVGVSALGRTTTWKRKTR